MFNSVEVGMEQWALWKRYSMNLNAHGVSGYKSILGNIRQRSGSRLFISDETGMKIDDGVEELIKFDHEIGEIISLHYLDKQNYSRIAERFNTNRKNISHKIEIGLAWIDGRVAKETWGKNKKVLKKLESGSR